MNKNRLTHKNTIPDICIQLNGVAPAPRRDFYMLEASLVQRKVHLIRWIITSRQEDGKLRPTEIVDSFDDFPSEVMMRYIPYVFGKDVTGYVRSLIDGHYDWLVRLPDTVLVHLMTYLNLEDIERLSHVCMRLKTVSTSDDLWRRLFKVYMPSLHSPDAEALAEESGWRSVFYAGIFERKVRAKHLVRIKPATPSRPDSAASSVDAGTAAIQTDADEV